MGTKRVINNKVVSLSNREKLAEEKFHTSRMTFAVINNIVEITINDKRDHMQWLSEDFNINERDFADITRGYVKQGKIVFYKGTDFKPINIENINDELINELKDKAKQNLKIDSEPFSIYNGVHVGNIGDEWEPIYEVVKLLGEYVNIIE